MNNWTIKYRLLFLAVLPLTVTVIILSIFFTANRLQQFSLEHERRGNSIVRQLAPASEYGIFSGNQEILRKLASSTLTEDDVIAVSITDQQGNSLIKLNKDLATPYDKSQTKDFQSDVYLSQLQINDFSPAEEVQKQPKTIGHVSITLTNTLTTSLQKRVLIENFTITGIILLLTIFFTLRMAKTLSRPLHTMSKAVSRISEGDFSYTANTDIQGELGTLDRGISTMASYLQKAKENERLQRKKLEDINKNLEEQIEQRKNTEYELREATHLANQANQAKSDFMGNMGHELRTPLNSIIGFSELLLMEDISPKQRDYALSVHNSCNDLLYLIRDILDFSKLEAGKLSVLSIAFDLRQCIEEVADSAALHCAEKNIELVVNYPSEQPHNLLGDPGRVRQIISNLVTNAIKFIEQGQIIIRTHVTEVENNIAQVHISIEDTGIGIAKDKLDTIFERFSQADTTSTRSYQGLGLGLTICKQLVKLMGGSLHVDSTFGEGSVFSIDLRFPLDRTALSNVAELGHLGGKYILLADDNAETRTALSQTLRHFGMRVDTVTDGASALSSMHTANTELTPYHLVFIDSEMKDMNIETMNRVIQQNNKLARSKLVLLTPVNKVRERSEDWRTSFSAILTKPVRFHDLTEALLHVFSSHGKFSESDKNYEQASVSHKLASDKALVNNKRILVVDDNEMNIKLALSVLKNIGYSVDTATNGQQAIDMIEESFYDIILMDILMPVMNGFAATREIRNMQDGCKKQSVIIALTAKALEGDREQCLAAGMDDYISKPLQVHQLRDLLEKF